MDVDSIGGDMIDSSISISFSFSVWESFIDSLMEEGRVLVSREVEVVSEPVSSELLMKVDSLHRNTLMDGMPQLDLVTGGWACRVLYVCCALVAQRQLNVNELDEVMKMRDGESLSDDVLSRLYSSDIFFHLLPRLYELVKLRSENDVLAGKVEMLARNYPFSAPGLVGVDILNEVDTELVNVILEDESMRNTWVDRIISTEAWQWLKFSVVKERVEEVVGNYGGLKKFKFMAKALKENEK